MRFAHFTKALLSTCAATPPPPNPGAATPDHFIRKVESYFAHIRHLMDGGTNAETYWSFAGDRPSSKRWD